MAEWCSKGSGGIPLPYHRSIYQLHYQNPCSTSPAHLHCASQRSVPEKCASGDSRSKRSRPVPFYDLSHAGSTMLKPMSTRSRIRLLGLARRPHPSPFANCSSHGAGFHSSGASEAVSAEPVWLKSPRDVRPVTPSSTVHADHGSPNSSQGISTNTSLVKSEPRRSYLSPSSTIIIVSPRSATIPPKNYPAPPPIQLKRNGTMKSRGCSSMERPLPQRRLSQNHGSGERTATVGRMLLRGKRTMIPLLM